jgi:hypothetical protein
MYARLAVGSSAVASAWAVACADAGFVPGDTAWLFEMAGQPPTAQHAVHFEPGSAVVIDIHSRLTDEQLVDLNASPTRYGDRVGVYPEAFHDPRELTAVLRHELEHALQFRLQPEAYRANDLLERMLSEARVYVGRGGNSLINALPIESDANAAGASLVCNEYGGIPDELAWGDHGSALRSAGLANPATLGARTVAWAAMHIDAFQRVCDEEATSAASVAGGLLPLGATWLEALALDDLIRAAALDAIQAVPSADAIDKARVPAAAWSDVICALRRGERRGVQLIGAGT